MFQVTMPQASNTMEEGTIVRWHKRAGEHVKQGEILLEIETDKATVEVESPAEGVVSRILAKEGEIVAIHGLIAEIGGEADAGNPAAPAKQAPAAPAAAAAPAAKTEAAGNGGNVVPIPMPQAGNTMETGTIVKWAVRPGDRIEIGQVLGEVETDKAVMDLESPFAGRVARIVASEGAIIAVREPVILLAESDADAEAWLTSNPAGRETGAPVVAAPTVASAPQARQAAPAAPSAVTRTAPPPPVAPRAPQTGGRVKASPAARQTAEARGVDLATLGAGSGPGGRILSTDLPADLPATGQVKAKTAAPATAGATLATGAISRPLVGMRKAIAKNLAISKQTIPHFYMKLTINAAPLMSFYKARKSRYPISLNDLILAACAVCQREIPQFRSRLEGEAIVEYPTGNIGIAVGTEDALLVPVVMGADQLTLHQLAATTRRTVESARGGKVLNGGRGQMTISNMGMFGVDEFSAIINPPEAAILAVAGVKEVVQVKDGAMRPGLAMTMTISADHRVIDGVVAARFMARMRELLENPESLNEAMAGSGA